MMQIFVKKHQGNTITLNVESNERICSIKSKVKEREGMRSDLHLGLIYNGKLLEDGHTLSHYKILKGSTLRLFLSQDTLVETWNIYVETWSKKSFTLKVKSVDTIDDVKAKIQAKKGIPPHQQLLFDLDNKLLEDGSRTLADYDISDNDFLRLAIQLDQGPQSAAATQPNVTSQEAPRQTKRARHATPTKVTSIFDTCDGEVQATAALVPESQACTPSSVLTELEDVKREMATARNKEKELEATISRLKAEIKKNEQELTINARNKEKGLEATISGLKAGNKENEEELTLARNKVKELEATISELKAENMKIEEIAQNKEKELEATISGLKVGNKKTEEVLTLARNKEKELEATISELKAENKKTEEELRIVRKNEKGLESSISNKKTEEEITLARNKEKELEATICGLRHKNKVFSDQCASYESLVEDLEVENKKTKEELMNADKKYYAGARAAGYAEGIREGKAKRQKSVEFLHHLTDASMRYFNHGFDSCQKQAEQQGFCGQLNKDSALKDAPDLKGWESSHQPH